jgi:peptide/nickel transport system ATP-binding protein
MALLEIKDLKTVYRTDRGEIKAVDGVSFRIEKGTNFGLVGESGCGKSTVLKTIVHGLPPNAYVSGGKILFNGEDLLRLGAEAVRKILWKDISMITQSAMNALDPVHPVGEQILEAIQAHENTGSSEARERVEAMLSLVGIDRERFSEYPHQFSGGMRQRAIIAMSLILKPSLVIADEPTTSLDVIVQDQIFKKIRTMQELLQFSMFLVTHDIAVVIENCREMGVMYGGRIVELGDVKGVIDSPFHPYTMGLKNSFPNIRNRHSEMISIPGVPPTLIGDLKGCRFHLRCPFSAEACSFDEPRMVEVGENHFVACHEIGNVDEIRQRAKQADTWRPLICSL